MILRFDLGKELTLVPHKDDFSQNWYNELIKNKDNIKEKDRVHGFNSGDNLEAAYEKLRKCVGLIQFYDDKIEWNDDLNKLHLYFESMMEDSYFLDAPSIIQNAIIQYNHLIHRIESIGSKRIVCTFNSNERYPLDESMQERFTFDQKPGTICINYCHIGKPLYDLYHDDDYSAELIVPQTEWCADFTIIYRHGKHKPFDEKAQAWLDKNEYEKKSWGLIEVGKVVPHGDDYLDGITRIETLDPRGSYQELMP